MGKSRDCSLNATWERELQMLFCDICVKEIELGNRPTTFFNKEGWNNIASNFTSQSGKQYTKLQLKNKWDQLKKEWKLWKELTRGSTGLGWDPRKRTIDASEEWWKEKLEVIPLAKKFKMAGIEPELEEKLNIMFEGVAATGHTVLATTTAVTDKEEIRVASNDISSDSEDNLHVVGESSRNKRPSTESLRGCSSKKGSGVVITSEISRLVNEVANIGASRSSANQYNSIRECIQIINQLPEVKSDLNLYMSSIRLMEKDVVRDLFRLLAPEDRIAFLRHYFEHP